MRIQYQLQDHVKIVAKIIAQIKLGNFDEGAWELPEGFNLRFLDSSPMLDTKGEFFFGHVKRLTSSHPENRYPEEVMLNAGGQMVGVVSRAQAAPARSNFLSLVCKPVSEHVNAELILAEGVPEVDAPLNAGAGPVDADGESLDF